MNEPSGEGGNSVRLSSSEMVERAGDGSGTKMLGGIGGLLGVSTRGLHRSPSISEVLLQPAQSTRSCKLRSITASKGYKCLLINTRMQKGAYGAELLEYATARRQRRGGEEAAVTNNHGPL